MLTCKVGALAPTEGAKVSTLLKLLAKALQLNGANFTKTWRIGQPRGDAG